MSALLRLFWDICIFRRGPQDMPYSRFLFGGLLLAYLIFGLFIYLLPDSKGFSHPLNQIMLYLFVDTAAWMGVLYLILRSHGYAARALQTLTTLLAIEIVLNLAHLPFILLVSGTGSQTVMSTLLNVFGTMLILLWELALYTHILRNALATSIFKAGGFALMLFVLSIVINLQMLPVSN